ncbi:hypothetical protein GUJ93_ZPchr0003g17092 [Zizania palustris]|uniref:Uncharacterized protein n=1 Tax=Zizania palustris TaxID=103762 RepID=A0A8J5RNN5_ZIZPA|nr:hypothetical protein GUJ93_ZPchr0003g17092 [Zizania palustris]
MKRSSRHHTRGEEPEQNGDKVSSSLAAKIGYSGKNNPSEYILKTLILRDLVLPAPLPATFFHYEGRIHQKIKQMLRHYQKARVLKQKERQIIKLSLRCRFHPNKQCNFPIIPPKPCSITITRF